MSAAAVRLVPPPPVVGEGHAPPPAPALTPDVGTLLDDWLAAKTVAKESAAVAKETAARASAIGDRLKAILPDGEHGPITLITLPNGSPWWDDTALLAALGPDSPHVTTETRVTHRWDYVAVAREHPELAAAHYHHVERTMRQAWVSGGPGTDRTVARAIAAGTFGGAHAPEGPRSEMAAPPASHGGGEAWSKRAVSTDQERDAWAAHLGGASA